MGKIKSSIVGAIRVCIPKAYRPYAGLALALLKAPNLFFSNPPNFNALLNYTEADLGRTRLLSYPVSIGINISNICNQKCLFCCHDNSRIIDNNWLDSELFSKMKWL